MNVGLGLMASRRVHHVSDLIGWTPFKLVVRPHEATVHWADLGDADFTEPAFRMTVEQRRPGPVTITGLEALEGLEAVVPHLAPSAFLFHMSRVGSTLLTNLLRCLDGTLVIAEPTPVAQLLLSPARDSAREAWGGWLRGLVAALGQPRRADQTRYFVKFTSYNVLQLDLVRRVFPEVPWVFLYRHPVEVMVSNLERPPRWMQVHHQPPAGRNFLGIEPSRLKAMTREEFFAEVFRSFCETALGAKDQGGIFLNYDQLTPGSFGAIAQALGADAADALASKRLQAVFAADAKDSGKAMFTPDRETKREKASPEVLKLCERLLSEPYRKMEAIRLPT